MYSMETHAALAEQSHFYSMAEKTAVKRAKGYARTESRRIYAT